MDPDHWLGYDIELVGFSSREACRHVSRSRICGKATHACIGYVRPFLMTKIDMLGMLRQRSTLLTKICATQREHKSVTITSF